MRGSASSGRARLTVVGDVLLDRDLVGAVTRVCPDAPVPVVEDPAETARPGGAGLAAVLAAQDGLDVTLVTPLAADPAGLELADLLAAHGVSVVALPHEGDTPEKVRVRAQGQSVVRLDRGRSGRVGALPPTGADAVLSADAVLVSDYGRGVTSEPTARAALVAAAGSCPLVWDPHPRGGEPVPGARLVTPNRAEAALLAGADGGGGSLAGAAANAALLRERWAAANVVVTLGAAGAVLVSADGTPLAVPAEPVRGGDPCGAGDRFAARAAAALAAGALPSEAVLDAVARAADFVAAGGASALGAPGDRSAVEATAEAVIARARAAGGTVVATGGCFDLLHAGHVRMLQAARALGDCLIVCLNDDDSVRRLKGPDRPLVPQDDRAAVLRALDCVDAVAMFSEDTPEALLDRLRPDIWAKGADYAVADLPEAPLVAGWGGQAVVVPYLDGRSTTRLIQEATRRAGT